jgi:hypothetical protein
MPSNNAPIAAKAAAPVVALKSTIDRLVNEFASEARRAAVLLSQHHRAFDGEVECQAVIKRVESILVDAGLALENVAASLSPEVKAALDTPRSLEITHRAFRG